MRKLGTEWLPQAYCTTDCYGRDKLERNHLSIKSSGRSLIHFLLLFAWPQWYMMVTLNVFFPYCPYKRPEHTSQFEFSRTTAGGYTQPPNLQQTTENRIALKAFAILLMLDVLHLKSSKSFKTSHPMQPYVRFLYLFGLVRSFVCFLLGQPTPPSREISSPLGPRWAHSVWSSRRPPGFELWGLRFRSGGGIWIWGWASAGLVLTCQVIHFFVNLP